MESITEKPNPVRQRHGCVLAWLIFMIIINSITAITNIFASEWIAKNMPSNTSTLMIVLLGIIGITNVAFAILLLKWKKIGFWGFTITSIVAFIINLSIGVGMVTSLLGLVGIAFLYVVLQIKKNGVTSWEHLE